MREEGSLSPLSWTQALRRVGEALSAARNAGEGRVLLWTGLETGTLEQLYGNLARATGGQHVMFDPNQVEPMLEGNRAAFGRYDAPRPTLSRSDFIVALEADMFETYLSPVELARQIVGPEHGGEHRAQLVWVGPRRGVTGMLADHWVPTRPGASGFIALALLRALASDGGPAASLLAEHDGLRRLLAEQGDDLLSRAGVEASDIEELARRLRSASHPAVLAPGPVAVGPFGAAGQAAIALLNYALGAYSEGFAFGATSALSQITPARDLRSAVERMAGGDVDVLIVADQNPAFDLPKGLGVEEAMARVGLTVSLTDRPNATSELCDLVLPTSTPLESWGDYTPRAGVDGLIQPVMDPVVGSRMAGDIVIGLSRHADILNDVSPEARTFEVAVRRRWQQRWGLSGRDAVERFREAQRLGGSFAETTTEAPEVQADVAEVIARGLRGLGEVGGEDRVELAPYAPIGTGLAEAGTGGWLDELPEPTNAVIWGSPAEIHPSLAERLGATTGDTITVRTDTGTVSLPVYVRDNIHEGVVALPIGGRSEDPERQWPEAPGNELASVRPDYRGSSAAALLAAEALQAGAGVVRAGHVVEVSSASSPVELFVESRHFEQHHRNLARAQGIDTHGPFHDLPILETEESRRLVDLHEIRDYEDHRWAMAIDLDRCTGCSACVVACYAENNISVVGPNHVDYGREMHWLQLHTYWERDHADRPIPLFMPVMCQHCHEAPCESVCPVYAPYHNPEGLNGQVYNRCVGTRFCSNNCPYKVRRFNWYDWPRPEPLNLQLNPDVTVRSAGVMEKCTFCVQRIREAKEEAKLADREMEDGDVVPACVQTCPTGALVFGDWLDPESRLRQLVESQHERGYHLLGHLGTRPAITYLERVVRWQES